MSIFDLTEKVALVTGGYGHLGSAMCRGLAQAGATVYVLGRSEDTFLQSFGTNELDVKFSECDIASTKSIQNSFASIFKTHKRIDILVNNAVYLKERDPLAIGDEEWAWSIDGVLNSVYRCIREVVPYFMENKSGKIINISSMYGVVSPEFSLYDKSPDFLNPPHYGAAKAGVIQLTKYYAQFLGEKGIQVNAISPGPFPSTPVQKDAAFVERLKKRTALKRVGKPEDLIGATVFLSSTASDYITGQNLIVDGGWTIS